MKIFKILLITTLFTNFQLKAQKFDTYYTKDWKIIDSLIIKNNATKSALIKVDAVYKNAKQQQNNSQIIKALIYKMELSDRVKEDNIIASIALLKKEVETNANSIAKSILWCLMAKQYTNYYNNNRWQIDRRSETTEKQKNDIAVWCKNDFLKQIFYCYDKSLEAKIELQKTDLKTFDALIVYGTQKKLRPTMFDILLHEALEYYKNYTSYNYYNVDNAAKNITNGKSLATEEFFLNAKFESDNSFDATTKALQLYQEIIKFHKTTNNEDALIDVSIERIAWAFSRASFTNKEELYIKALEEVKNKYKTNKTAHEAWFLLAQYYSNRANSFKTFTTINYRFDYIKALEIINESLQIFKDSSEAFINSINLKNNIERKEISTKIETVNVPNQPFRMLVNYRNTNNLFYRIIKLKNGTINNEAGEENETYNNDNKFWEQVINKKYIKQVEQILPKQIDYQNHSCEIKIDALPVGAYAILTSTSKDFDINKDKLSYINFNVSSLSYIENNGDYFVVDRESGKPIEGATVNVEKKYWDNGKYKQDFFKKFTTDKNGFFSFKKHQQQNYYYGYVITITKNDDVLVSNANGYYTSINNEDLRSEGLVEKENMQVHLFADRGIYRPGQTVFFKGITTTKSKNASESKLYLQMPKNKIFLRDVNGKTIDTVDFEVNEFGSFSGKFTLPINTLTGNFSLVSEFGGSYLGFQVEEYKRPKFYVDYEKQKGEFKLNKEVKIVGNAKAYSGNSIDGAKVKYVVKRKARFEGCWWWWRMPKPNSNAKQIKNGEIKTNEKGQFEISFIAEADETIDRNTNPIFDYEINASVTDINGETREGITTISVGYNSLILKIDAPEKVDISNFKNLKLSATNLAGESIATKVDIKISSLQTPTRLIRQRFWERADAFVYTQDEYINYFPFDEYDNETDKLIWKEKEVVLKDTISTINNLQSTIYTIKPQYLKPNSQYLITLTAKDKEGNLVETKAYVELIIGNNLAYPQYNVVANTKTSAKAGETVNVGFNSAAQKVYVLKNLVTPNNKPKEESINSEYSFEEVNNNFIWNKQFEANATKGFGMYYAFVKNNRFYSGGSNIELIKPCKKLNISYGTFRNKTLPGSKETYTLKISGEQGEKVAAELLTAMYDASLDQFVGHNWRKPELEEGEYYSSNFRFSNLQNINNSQIKVDNISLENKFQFEEKYSWLAKKMGELMVPMYINLGRIVMRSSDNEMNEVVVGYSNSKKKNYAGSVAKVAANDMNAPTGTFDQILQGKVAGVLAMADSGSPGSASEIEKREENAQTSNNNKQSSIRKNFNETAFFFPHVYANEKGEYSFSFTMPEALTKWKWMSLAHTKNLNFGYSEETVVTTKPIMVQPNTPRFLREGDVMEFTAKIVNTTDKEIIGTANLELIDATTGNSVDGLFNNVFPMQYFTAAANQSSVVKFPIQVPANFAKPLTVRVIASSKTGNNVITDGEENILPVLTNKIFLTESLPIYLKPNETNKEIDLKPLFNTASNRSGESMTVEYTSNPIWSVVQALPYLMEYPYECAEQTFNRFFANAMASSIVKNNPNIQKVLKKWKEDTSNIKSKLQLNEELKSIINTETPWVFDAESEVEQQKRLALLLDLDKMQNQIDATIEKLKTKQMPSGAFSWFDGGRENEYITQYIVTGIGKLKTRNILNESQQNQLNQIAAKALKYLDNWIENDYKNYLENLKNKNNKQIFWGNSLNINYWYMRSMFLDYKLSPTLQKASKLFIDGINKSWTKQSIYMQGLQAITLFRLSNATKPLAKKILNSIKENAVEGTAKGTMYWKQNQYCYYWYQNNFETHALLMQAFDEIEKDNISIDKMKTWLILNKQSNKWNSTISTSAACYAILNYGSNWVGNQQSTQMQIGTTTIKSNSESGGYIKTKLDEVTVNKIANSNQPQITISNQSINKSTNSPSYGAVFFQYFADVNDVKSSNDKVPLTLVKKLFIEKNNGTKKLLEPVNDNDELQVGDKLIIRIELRCDRQMEFLHLKDMRAANTEPTNVLSGYRWQDGLGYYESTRDASTNFFIDYMQRGTYVFEYPLYITHSGNYSVGLAQIQCMYAPEFVSHSNGIKIRVK